MIIGAVAILLTVVVVLAVRNINREKLHMSRILREKGSALIKSFEAGTRTGMMGMRWGGAQIQSLLEETARQPGILYLGVTDENGLILAHNDRSLIGKRFLDDHSLQALQPRSTAQWRLTDYQTGRHSFEVYRQFLPLAGRHPGRHRGPPVDMREGRPMSCAREWCSPQNLAGNRQIIFVGLDPEPFEAARREDMRNTLITSGILLVLGFGGFVSLFLAQSYRTTRRRLQDTSAFADEVVTNLPVGLVATGRDGRIAFFNEAAEKITKIRLDEARGNTLEELLPSPWSDLQPLVDEGRTVVEKEMECSFGAGPPAPLSVSASKIVNEDGDFVGNILILRDLGEVRRLQEEIRRKEKLAALGNLAAGVAHEIRNPLSSIKGFATYFGAKFGEGSEDRESADMMIGEVDRLNRVISELLEFARPSDLNLKPVQVNELLQHSLRLIQQDAGARNIEIDFSAGDDSRVTLVDPDRFTQALLNLYLNAIQAMNEGGVLSVRSSFEHDEQITIEVSDTGSGIGPEDLTRVFDPYFTTKPRGAGLGLAIVHKIVEAHNGEIKIRSTPGTGTVVSILLPLEDTEREAGSL
jgi:two-component system sensor histidine kinase HydH